MLSKKKQQVHRKSPYNTEISEDNMHENDILNHESEKESITVSQASQDVANLNMQMFVSPIF